MISIPGLVISAVVLIVALAIFKKTARNAQRISDDAEEFERQVKKALQPLRDGNIRMATENEALRVELARIKPSWDAAPDNAEYLAQDADWSWWFHAEEPRLVERDETEDTPFWGSRGWCDSVFSNNWRETLERRPEGTDDV